MTELSKSQWLDITKACIYLPQDAGKRKGRFIALDTLQMVLRKSLRTNSQNSLLWALYADILALGGETLRGWRADDLHDFFLIQHFGSEIIEGFGMKRHKPLRRSSKLSKTEFKDFLEHIVQFMAEKGVYLVLPGDPNEVSPGGRRDGPAGDVTPENVLEASSQDQRRCCRAILTVEG